MEIQKYVSDHLFTVYKYKISKKATNKYVTIHIYDREVKGNESVSDLFDVTISKNDTQINFNDIINV